MTTVFAARCIAPPITDQHIADWPNLIRTLPDNLKDKVDTLLDIVRQHKDDPNSITKEQLPSRQERDIMGTWFDALPASGPHRDPAYHLLWYVNELSVGRNPNA